jgi:hypothetical protein
MTKLFWEIVPKIYGFYSECYHLSMDIFLIGRKITDIHIANKNVQYVPIYWIFNFYHGNRLP